MKNADKASRNISMGSNMKGVFGCNLHGVVGAKITKCVFVCRRGLLANVSVGVSVTLSDYEVP